jgi:hypothetical protein
VASYRFFIDLFPHSKLVEDLNANVRNHSFVTSQVFTDTSAVGVDGDGGADLRSDFVTPF